ncbi:GntR family transcriptional regulator [Mycolicibacterium goodii]|uniref:GntR family transcriptional regulator n=1 Tax=Mycolicibacterium goodii TaxID=134601 RepID=UPI001304558C|nr:GntR family transcriptional regulator [Mycolicibacterium goodii]
MGSETKKVPASSRAYAWIKNQIIRGYFAEGSYIEEEIVCSAIGVSRTPVREAFRQLAAERFIALSPRRGAQVITVTARDIAETYEVRRLMEYHACRDIVGRGIKPPEEMSEILAVMHEPDKVDRCLAGDPDAWYEAVQLDIRFHRAIVSATGNALLTEFYDTLRARQHRVSLTAVRNPERKILINEEHTALYESLVAGDAEQAVEVLSKHLQPINQRLGH